MDKSALSLNLVITSVQSTNSSGPIFQEIKTVPAVVRGVSSKSLQNAVFVHLNRCQHLLYFYFKYLFIIYVFKQQLTIPQVLVKLSHVCFF